MPATPVYVDPTRPDDLGDGLSLDMAKKTIPAGLTVLQGLGAGAKGSPLYLLNTGVHAWPTAQTIISNTNLIGTSWDDPGFIIRGVDTNLSPAMVTIRAAAAGAHRMVRIDSSVRYVIVENLIGDLTLIPSDASTHRLVEHNASSGNGLVKMRYCALLGAPSGQLGLGTRQLLHANTFSTLADVAGLEYCYIQNVQSMGTVADLASRQMALDHVIYINDSLGGRGGAIFPTMGVLVVGDSTRILRMINCTVYEDSDTNDAEAIMQYSPAVGVDAGTVDCYSNLKYVKTSASIYPLMRASGSSGVIHAGTIGPNVLIGGPGTSSAQLTAAGHYQTPWDANDDDTTPPDEWPLDIVTYGEADTDIFNDPSSTYDWELPNGLVITILKDLRPKKYQNAGLFGATPGALPAIAGGTDDGGGDPIGYCNTIFVRITRNKDFVNGLTDDSRLTLVPQSI
jgi:hypothetical protein